MEIMKSKDILEEVLKSWEKCRTSNLNPFIKKPMIKLPDNNKEKVIRDNKNIIEGFKNVIQEVEMLNSNYICILTDKNNTIIDCYIGDNNLLYFYNNMFKSGYSLVENSIGTNALLFANKKGKPVWFYPKHHYCYNLKTISSFSIPLISENNTVAFLSVLEINQMLNENIIVITRLIAKLLIYKLEKSNYKAKTISNIITSKQKCILRYLAEGCTEQAVACEMNISINTVRDHKKGIYKKLKVSSTCEAVVKAIKLGILDINKIGMC
jgi:DNA-binding CsgD family transcriptional regulator